MTPTQYGGYRYSKSKTKKKQRGYHKRSLSNRNLKGGHTKRRRRVKSRRIQRTKRKKIYV